MKEIKVLLTSYQPMPYNISRKNAIIYSLSIMILFEIIWYTVDPLFIFQLKLLHF